MYASSYLSRFLSLTANLQFTERTPGSFIEEREASMVWRFWTGETMDHPDRHWAKRQAAEAQNHIFDSYVFQSILILPHSYI